VKKGYIRLLIVCFLFIGFLTLNEFLDILNIYTLAFFIFILAAAVYYYLGYEKNNPRYQRDTVLNVLIYSVTYLIVTNLLGLLTGFYRTIYNLSLLSMLKNTIPIILIIILSELIRYMIVAKAGRYIAIQALTVIIFVLLDMTVYIGSFKGMSADVVRYSIAIILPSITKNIMLTYITSKAGYKPAVLYRVLFEVPAYMLPIFPNFGLYVGGVLQIISPVILLCIIYYSFFKLNPNPKAAKPNKVLETAGTIIVVVILFAAFSLTSGWFKYYAITIGSGSMEPRINIGDVAIVQKLNTKEINNLKEGQILVFNHSGRTIIHRIIRIVPLNNENYFYTKGDNNNTEDGYPIEVKDIIGTASLKIPYIGYPTLWLQKLTQ